MSFRNPNFERRRVVVDTGEGLTEQHHKRDVDMHFILRKERSAILANHVSAVEGRYAEFPGAQDFHAAMNMITEAQEMFETVPAEIRARFNNDPGAYVDFMVNKENYDDIRKLGLPVDHLPKPPEPVPPKASPEPGGNPAPSGDSPAE